MPVRAAPATQLPAAWQPSCMAFRTCDLRQLAIHVRELTGEPPSVVAVSGFPAAGKSTLAGLLGERLDGAAVVAVDDLLDPSAGQNDLTPDLAPGAVAAHEAVLREVAATTGTGTVVIEGQYLLHPDLWHLADVHVWVDADLNRANGNQLTRELERRRRVGDDRPLGRWSSGPPRPQPVPPAQRFADRHRPDLAAECCSCRWAGSSRRSRSGSWRRSSASCSGIPATRSSGSWRTCCR